MCTVLCCVSKVQLVGDCVMNIQQLEEKFVDLMTSGMMTYSRPLRYHILTASQHSALFQNVEKVRSLHS